MSDPAPADADAKTRSARSTPAGDMTSLATYVAAIHAKPGAPTVAEKTVATSHWQDQSFDVRREVTTYRFDNAVTIRATVEQDSFPDELACAECWISYEVLSNGASAIDVRPLRKVFENACRESFWLAYHMA